MDKAYSRVSVCQSASQVRGLDTMVCKNRNSKSRRANNVLLGSRTAGYFAAQLVQDPDYALQSGPA